MALPRLVYSPREKKKSFCPCKPESESDSCLDDRYLCHIMTSKDVLFPKVEVVRYKPTEEDILAGFTSKQIAEFKDAFDFFDKECKGAIQPLIVGQLMRGLGETAIMPEMLQLMKDISEDGDGLIDFNGFLRIIARSKVHTDLESELREAFRIFDKEDTGYIPANVLRFDLINLGEILTDEQVDLMIPQLDINDDGMVRYDEIIEWLIKSDIPEESIEEEETEEQSVVKGRIYRDCPVVKLESESSMFEEEMI